MEHQFGIGLNDTQWGLDNYEQWFGGTLPAVLGIGYYLSRTNQLYFTAEKVMYYWLSELYRIYYTSKNR